MIWSDFVNGDIFIPTDILLPKGIAMDKWSVIACDQFSSDRDYWERVYAVVGGNPSTLNMIIPETYLGECDDERCVKISETMADYIERGLFEEIHDSFILVKRTLTDGTIRWGLLGAVDLERYDFSDCNSAVSASEGTVLDRLPTRINIRRSALLELPHIMAFINDKDRKVIEGAAQKADKLPVLYDFELMEGGGHIKGMRMSGEDAQEVRKALRALAGTNPFIVIGDGNHSLAAAKVYWDELKQTLSETERQTHPARYALLEINNVYDPAICFDAIHRVIFNVKPTEILEAMQNALPAGGDYQLRWFAGEDSGIISAAASCIGELLSYVREFLDDYTTDNGCRIDYIHGADTVRELSRKADRLGLLLPIMDKAELFDTVSANGVFPKKSFSVGQAREKRYYLECRALR